MAAALRNTTTSVAINADTLSVKVGSVTGVVLGMIAYCDREAMLVNKVDSDNAIIGIQRGYAGTIAAKHASGAVIWVDKPEYFGIERPVGTASATTALALPCIVILEGRGYRVLNDSWVEVPTMRLAGARAIDPDTGYEYLLVKCTDASATIGDWWVVDADGNASAIATTSKGRIGVCIETISAANTYTWGLVVGSVTAKFTSDVTTGCVLKAGSATVDISSSAGGNVIFNASCTGAPSSATDLGTAYLNNPWCYGITTDIIP